VQAVSIADQDHLGTFNILQVADGKPFGPGSVSLRPSLNCWETKSGRVKVG